MRMPSHVSKVHCGSALGPGASVLPYYCAPFVCVLNGLGELAVWRLTHKQTNKRCKVRVNLPTLCVGKARRGFQQVCILILMKFKNLVQNLVQHLMCYVGRRPTQPIPQPISHSLGCCSLLVQLDCFSYNLLK